MNKTIDSFFPENKVKFAINDKPFITLELKQLKRRRQREYIKNGKSPKYFQLKNELSKKFKKVAENYLKKIWNQLSKAIQPIKF